MLHEERGRLSYAFECVTRECPFLFFQITKCILFVNFYLCGEKKKEISFHFLSFPVVFLS